MTPFYFGPVEAPLFGMYGAPRPSVAREAAILLCAPIGLEYMRTHYAIRLLALQLATAGFHVLRFDYHGTGDSSGDVGAGQFDIWTSDVALALQELSEISGVSAPTVVGIRMGAVIALEAIAVHKPKVQGLVLWDPVVEGREYLTVLKEMHAQTTKLRRVPPRPTNELLGAVFPADLRAVIEDIHLEARVRTLDARGAALVVSEDRPEYRSLLKGMQDRWPDAAYRPMADPAEWNNLNVAYAARMTGPIIRAVAEAAESLT